MSDRYEILILREFDRVDRIGVRDSGDGMKVGKVPNDDLPGRAPSHDQGAIRRDINVFDLIGLGEVRLFAPREGVKEEREKNDHVHSGPHSLSLYLLNIMQ